MIKIKRFKKHINEEILSRTTDQLKNTYQTKTPSIEEINDLFGQVLDQKKLDMRKLYSSSNSSLERARRIPISRINVPVNVTVQNIDTGTNEEITFIPEQLTSYVDRILTKGRLMQGLGIILSYITKPIIWTFDIPTAASDGIRIAFNPAFAYQLIEKSKANLKQKLTKYQLSDKERDIEMNKYILFILIHEIYHEIYRHKEQAQRKSETSDGKNHSLANIAMDVEINRDIERQLNAFFGGIVSEIGGMFDNRFPKETWDIIFDQYFSGDISVPVNPRKYNNTIKPRKIDRVDSNGGGLPNEKHSDDYIQGYGDGIQDVVDNKVDPSTYSFPEPTNDYEQGYNDAIKEIKQGKEEGITRNSNSTSQPNTNDLPQIPWEDMDNNSSISNSDDNLDSDSQSSGNGQSGQQQKKSDMDNSGNDKSGNGQGDESDTDEQPNSNRSSNSRNNHRGNNSDMNNQTSSNRQRDNSKSDMDNSGNDKSGNNSDSNMDQNSDSSSQSNQKEQQISSHKNASGAGNSLSSDDLPKLEDKSDDYKKAYAEQMQEELDKLLGNDSEKVDTSNDTLEQSEARQQAKQDIADAMKKFQEEIENEQRNSISDEEIAKEYEGRTFDTEISGDFKSGDMLTPSQMASLAEAANDPYTSEEMSTNPIEKAKKWTKDNKDKLSQVSPQLVEAINNIADKLAVMQPLADWKQLLKQHFRDAMKGNEVDVRSRRTMSQTWRDDRYNPYKTIEETKNESANVFYLIDNSGSMYSQGQDIFLRIFKEIITVEKTCHVAMSARAYFTHTILTKDNVALWDQKTSKEKILKLLADQGGTGGTEIAANVLAVTKLKKPYYYQTADKHTTILVFTDGEEYGDWSELDAIPSKIRKDIVFVLINNETQLLNTRSQLMSRGIKSKNILGINVANYK